MSIPGKLIPEAIRTLGRTRATVSYPETTRDLPERFRGAIEFDPEGCTGCGMCARHCAADAITVDAGADGITWRYDVAQCMFCGQCADSCPTDTIDIGQAFELASTDKPSFEETYEFER